MSETPEFNALPPEFEDRMKQRRQLARQRREENVAGPSSEPRRWGPYELLEEIGEGPAGRVWRAREGAGEPRAVKLLRRAVVAEIEVAGTRQEMARQRAAAVAAIDHPNLVRVVGVEEHSGQLGIVMEFVEASTLDDLLRQRDRLPFPQVMELGVGLCRGLAQVHLLAQVHGDIKTRNVLLTSDGRVLLSEPGTARDAHGGTNDRALALLGSPLTLAPEQFEGSPQTVATDLYSIGVVLFQALTRSTPAKGPMVGQLRESHRRRETRRLADLRPDLPSQVVRTVEKALAFDPEERYESADALAAALTAAAGVDPEEARRERATGFSKWWISLPTAGRRGIVAAGILGFFVLVWWTSR